MDRLDTIDRSVTSGTDASDDNHSHTAWSQAVDHAQSDADDPPPQETASHVVQKGETLAEISTRYRVPIHDIATANPAISNRNLIHVGQTLTIPLDKAGGSLPGRYTAQQGETLGGIAQHYHSSASQLAAANGIHDPGRIHSGDQIWIPGAGGQVALGTAVQESDLAALPPVTTPQAGKVNGAILGVQSAQQALNLVSASAAKGNASANVKLQDGSLQRNLGNAQGALNAAVNAEITAKAGAHANDTAVADAGRDMVARYTQDPGAQDLVSRAVSQLRTDRQVQAVVGPAQSQHDPVKALRVLNAGYAKAPQNVQQAVLADPGAKKIVDTAVNWANQPLTQEPSAGEFPQALTAQAIGRLNAATKGLDKSLAGTVADAAAPAYQAFAKDPQHGGMPLFGMQGMTSLMNVTGGIVGSNQGDEAISRFASTDAWNGDAVGNAIGSGADPAYAIELGRQIKAAGQDPGIVVQTINDGIAAHEATSIANGGSPQPTLDVAKRMQAAGLDASDVTTVATDGVQQFKDKVKGDVEKLAQHDAELAWLVKNDGAGMTPQQLNRAVEAYRTQQGADWQKQDAALRQQVASDGSKLVQQMVALNQSAPQLHGASASVDQTLKTIANDPAAGLAISTAIQQDPQLATTSGTSNAADVFTLSKVGDIGRKFTNELASSYVRQQVLSKLQGLDLSDPASVSQAKQAIQGLDSEPTARMLGVTRSELKKAVGALDQAVNNTGSTPEEADAALTDFSNTLSRDASLSKAFNKFTFPGQVLRGVAVAFAGASLINSDRKFNANPSDPQNDIKLMVDSAGFAQKNSELLVGLGKIDKNSALGQFGGEWKLAGRASAGDLITGISAVLDGASAVRSGFGLGEKQDTGSAIFSATTSVGGAMAVAPAFGAAAWLGPVGLGVTAVGVIGNQIYQDVKAAHQYEGSSQAFLRAGGYDPAAAEALSKQDGILSGASGGAQMPFLAKYAELKGLTPVQLQDWVNGLTPGQVNDLSQSLLQTAGDSHGDPANFTKGPPQTQIITGGSWYPAQITLANTLGVFEGNLDHDHVPHP